MSDINELENSKIINEKKNKYESQERWQKKAGYISKAYKLKQETVDKFAEACKKANTSQAAQIKILMEDFIEKTFKE